MPPKIRLAVLVICLLWLSGAAGATAATPKPGERILSFHSEITVHPDASMTVEETITVVSMGRTIKRGIYRDFPTRYENRTGQAYVIDFTVQEVRRNGGPEPYRLENLPNGIRIYIGSNEILLNPGRHTYRITYNTNRQLGFFFDFDELYWNVTGNAWALPIEKASAAVHLPPGASQAVRETDGYTGVIGARGKDFIARRNASGVIEFSTTGRLKPGEGFTLVVSWPKGFVTEPSAAERVRFWVRDNKGLLIGGAGLVFLFFYYLVVWARYGKDPPRGTIIPLFEPPQKLSPASLRFLIRMGYDEKAFTAAVINMAVKGYLTIEEVDGLYTLRKTGIKRTTLSPEEQAAANRLFTETAESIKIGLANRPTLLGARTELQRSLQGTLDKTYFATNRKYFFFGTLISFAILIASSAYGPSGAVFMALFLSTWFAGWTFGVVLLLRSVFSLWKGVLSGSGQRAVLFPKAVFLSLFSIPFVLVEIGVVGFVTATTSPAVLIILATMVFINLLFLRLLRAHTPMGRKLLDGIEGFRMYLTTAEKSRLNILNPPDRTPELFEKYLPYALALDVEQKWSEQFSGILGRIHAADGGYTPSWYSGTAWRDASFGGFASGLGAALTSATAAASSSSSPGSTSGGGGGGSSGGGGGGGGGGGW